MTAYAIVTLTITDPEQFDRYRAQAGAALEKHQITTLQVSKSPQKLEGIAEVPQLIVLLSATNAEDFHAWHNDSDFAEVHEMRRSSGDVSLMLL